MKFLCDQMLVRLGKWLRAAGYDTHLITHSMQDLDIFKLAQKENRLLLTRDIHFLSMQNASDTVIFLQGNSLEELVLELTQKLKINWKYKPLSRCLQCNTLLEVAPSSLYQRLPADIQVEPQMITYCKTCDKLFWMGSHTDRMINQLTIWQRLQQ